MNITDLFNKYPSIFPYQEANKIQCDSFNDIFHSNKSVIIKAPTGSGKTVIFEITILKCLLEYEMSNENYIILYVAPLKSLCREKFISWQDKFKIFNIAGMEITGDYEVSFDLSKNYIIFTTPEKLDSLTRKHDPFVNNVKLLCFDEIHTINDEIRGVTLEVVITRLKYLLNCSARFVALSATIGNIEDFVTWFSTNDNSCVAHEMSENNRSVKLSTQVLAYPRPNGQSLFQFDNILNHRIPDLISSYSGGKPVLVFCMTRKSTMQIAKYLVDQTRFELETDQLQRLAVISQRISEEKLRACIIRGIGFHHAGLCLEDRQIVENSFLSGVLPVLSSTSTLSMGVNLPAHLVIIKGTYNYNCGVEQTYSQNKLLQMIGRAGRPQFDSSAKAIILTSTDDELEIKKVLQLTCEAIESHLHNHLTEHLNAEIAVQPITNVEGIYKWIQSTFFYIRIFKNPAYYGVPFDSILEMIPNVISEIIMKHVNKLSNGFLIDYNDKTNQIESTSCGQLMTRYFLDFNTMQGIRMMGGSETLDSLITFISQCSEFNEINLRYTERGNINNLNKHRGPSKLRFPIKGRIMNASLKINCLIQAVLGCQEINDSSLEQDTEKIFRIGLRILRCAHDYWFQVTPLNINNYQTLLNCTLLKKCFHVKLWDNSWFVSQQIPGVRPDLAIQLTNFGFNTLNRIANAEPHSIESIFNHSISSAKTIIDYACGFPRYELTIEQIEDIQFNSCCLDVTVTRTRQKISGYLTDCDTRFYNDSMIVLIGDQNNCISLKSKIINHQLVNNAIWRTRIDVMKTSEDPYLFIDLISELHVGFDIRTKFKPIYQNTISPIQQQLKSDLNFSVKTKKLKLDNTKIDKNIEIQRSSSKIKETLSNVITPVVQKPKVFPWKSCQISKTVCKTFNHLQCHSETLNNSTNDEICCNVSPSDIELKRNDKQTLQTTGMIMHDNMMSVDLDKSINENQSFDDSFEEEMSRIDLQVFDEFNSISSKEIKFTNPNINSSDFLSAHVASNGPVISQSPNQQLFSIHNILNSNRSSNFTITISSQSILENTFPSNNIISQCKFNNFSLNNSESRDPPSNINQTLQITIANITPSNRIISISEPSISNKENRLINSDIVKIGAKTPISNFSEVLPFSTGNISREKLYLNKQQSANSELYKAHETILSLHTPIKNMDKNICRQTISIGSQSNCNNLKECSSSTRLISKEFLEKSSLHNSKYFVMSEQLRKMGNMNLSPIENEINRNNELPDAGNCSINNRCKLIDNPVTTRIHDSYSDVTSLSENIYNQGWEELFDFIERRLIINKSRSIILISFDGGL